MPHADTGAPTPADVVAAFAEVERAWNAHFDALCALETATAAMVDAEKRYALMVDAVTRAAEATP